jgi:sodium/potassium-transporting ATPase subunit alpha
LMSVANTWFPDCKLTNKEFSARNANEANAGSLSPQVQALINVAALNSRVVIESKIDKDDPSKDVFYPNGDATELGLYRFFGSCIQENSNQSLEDFRSKNAKVHEVPFNSKNKWQMSIHAMTTGAYAGKELLLLKGAPDVLLGKCSRYLASDGTIREVDEAFSTHYVTVYEEFGGNGERVLGFAMRPMDLTVAEAVAVNEEYKEELKAALIGAVCGVDHSARSSSG